MIVLELFRTFFMIGLVSFGGGYAMIPVIEREVTSSGWMTTQEFTDIIALAGMSPGPIATNSAVIVGYQTAGVPGAIFSALGMVLPSLIIILIVATFFFKASKNRILQSAFYGLRPIIVGLIIYAAVTFAISNNLIGSLTYKSMSLLLIFILSLFALIRLRFHPAYVIILSGLVGVLLYS
ncbi:chromate transporter [Alkalihalophilus lindianensis]|uniref:Chromate transporter n=1 Tax=Alkalihalophilus lindianensis TaxID=1630542 RepID=A0ABU3XCI9_9BACI|nr:chromate transporter [Alkalihalophilus lindianensis]MDV2685590.1 chromate transporter [Alkalihalophilus lindianensis]